MHSDEYPCPCDACDSFSLAKGEYCVTCEHHGCGWQGAKCPPAQRSDKWCDYCNEKKDETVEARPEADAENICADCHPRGELPDEDEWWIDEQNDDDDSAPDPTAVRAEQNHAITEF